MPVPSSYNDITQDAAIRDHIGWAWYDREFFVADYWSNSNVFVRFGSANYHAIVVSPSYETMNDAFISTKIIVIPSVDQWATSGRTRRRLPAFPSRYIVETALWKS